VPLPAALSYGSCYLYSGLPCSTLTASGYWPGAKYGDLTSLITLGAFERVSTDVTADILIGTGRGGARAADAIATVGIIWAPKPPGASGPSPHDRDGDDIPDDLDACPDEPEDRDGFQDEDGCPDPDNDGDGIPDAKDRCPNDPEDRDGFQDEDGCPDPDNDGDGIPDAKDKCPNEPEDRDGFQDEDGCPDPDNDGDGIPDAQDKCPNAPETFNGYQDEDGCPDTLPTAGPQERADRIDLVGAHIAFGKDGKLTPATKQVLAQVAAIIKQRHLTVRVEVHVPLGTKSTAPAAVSAQKKKDKQLAQQRAQAILDDLFAQGVALVQLQAVAIGSDRPLGTANPADPLNERVDFIKAQQGVAP
jgi:outer membrane protein OmpA-like peptidoglycan-associated protein